RSRSVFPACGSERASVHLRPPPRSPRSIYLRPPGGRVGGHSARPTPPDRGTALCQTLLASLLTQFGSICLALTKACSILVLLVLIHNFVKSRRIADRIVRSAPVYKVLRFVNESIRHPTLR